MCREFRIKVRQFDVSGTFNKTCKYCEKYIWKKANPVFRDSIFDTDQGRELIKQSFMGHSSISRIKQNSSIQRFLCDHETA